jgi:hypothetical protein
MTPQAGAQQAAQVVEVVHGEAADDRAEGDASAALAVDPVPTIRPIHFQTEAAMPMVSVTRYCVRN